MISAIARYVIPATLDLIPARMASPAAVALLLAIGLQESGFNTRRQRGGPARGFWQFEIGGVVGVRTHPATRRYSNVLLRGLEYDEDLGAADIQTALEHNDLLAAGFARLLLFTSALDVPDHDAGAAWELYLATWRPGKPIACTWPGLYAEAWTHVAAAPTLNA